MSNFMPVFAAVAPASGATIPVANTSDYNVVTRVNPAAGLGALTISFSTADQVPVGAIRRFIFQKAITLLSFAGATPTGAIATPLAGTAQTFQLLDDGTWFKIA